MFIANGAWSDKVVPLTFRPLNLKQQINDQTFPSVSSCIFHEKEYKISESD